MIIPRGGGYHSPAQSHTIGAAFRLQTAEARSWVLSFASFTGWQFARTAVIANGSARTAAARQDGLNAVGEATAAYRLAENWILGGLIRYQASLQYNDTYAGPALTYFFGARRALVSTDLPRFDLR